MKLLKDGEQRFDRFLPIYNWYYPVNYELPDAELAENPHLVFNTIEIQGISMRALYFHIPFCETICSFCPFVRASFEGDDILEKYTQALLAEIYIKSQYSSITGVPINSIFFGGGTPSVLNVDQILRLGKAIRESFDLSQMREFSFELEVKSITPEKLDALRSIGVTHARFGLQTFNAKYRRLFDLTATLAQVYYALDIIPKFFPYASFDMLYGMNGQSAESFVEDIELAIATGWKNIDFYPINNLVTQTRLHHAFREEGLQPVSGNIKFWMNVVLREYMREAGYLPHNGHGYVRVPPDELRENPVVTNLYSFEYHRHVYGYSDADLIGFGTNAISSTSRYTMSNTSKL